jgi:hypothetical protein
MIICLWQITNVLTILVRHSAGKIPFVRHSQSCDDNIVIDVKEIGYEDMD